MTEKYYIFENVEGEVIAVMEFSKREAIAVLNENFGEGEYELIDSFVADSWGDLRIDAMGLDVF